MNAAIRENRSLLLGLSASALLIHLLTNGRSGYFRDELYFMTCGDHLAWGYVDFAPLAAWLVHINRAVVAVALFLLNLIWQIRHQWPTPDLFLLGTAAVHRRSHDPAQANRRAAEQRCLFLEDGPEVGHPYAMGEEHYQIFVCRGLRKPLPYLWPQLKHWN